MSKTSEKWIVILNPHAGGSKGRRDQKEIEKSLKKEGFTYELLISEYPKHAIQLAQDAVEQGATQIIIAGGDGTLNEVLNGIFRSNASHKNEVVTGVIPVGTGNDWIRTFGIPNNYNGAVKKIVERKVFRQDIGKIIYTQSGAESTRYFLNMAGFGFDALAAQKANQLKDKGHTGLWIYLVSVFRAYLEYQTEKARISIDNNELEDYIFSASLGIGKYNGAGMMQAPGAIPNNGLFEVTIIKKIGLAGILRNLIGLYNGNYVKDRRVSCYQAKKITIWSQKPLAGEVDGESLGKSQFQIEVLPQQLQIIVGDME
ncbi:diacylglycerol/lipid kinase family protein [Maribellus sediminis]|uniref:diacylglycerol/lipid kinase family protein n=1 Tax=Maribellus sediminis TaxID=2696285 RepID=UPI001430A93B|nr:diacylglycerol kinase family protein [Maribellus sediminis]